LNSYSASQDRRRNMLSSLTGEFTRPAQEAEFRASIWPVWHRRARVVVLTGIAAYLITLLADYLLIGGGVALGLIAAGRLIVGAYGLGFITVAARRASPRFSDLGLLVFLLLLITVFLAMVSVRPDGLRFSGPACVLILCIFYALPMCRLWFTFCSTLYLSAGILVVAAWFNHTPARELAIFGVQLFAINLIGIFIALRQHHDVRMSWINQRSLELRERHQRLLARLSAQFLGLRADQVDAAVQQALRAIVEYTDSDRAYLLAFDADHAVARKTHEWCTTNIPPMQLNTPDFASGLPPWTLFKLQRGEVVQSDRVSELPPEAAAEREQAIAQGLRSFLCVPLSHDGLLLGMIGLDRLREERIWQMEIVELMRFIGQASFNALNRAQAEQNLKKREAQYQALATLSPAGLFQTDADGYCLYVNERWSQLAGLARESALGDGWTQALHVDDIERVRTRWRKAMTGKQAFEDEFRIGQPDGSVSWMHSQATPQLDERGQLIGYIGTMNDITERKRAQGELVLRAQLDELVARLTLQFLRDQDEDVETLINSALAGIGAFSDADRCGFFLFDLAARTMTCRYQWSRGSNKPSELGLVGLPIDEYSWASQRLLRGEIVNIPSVQDMPAEAAQERLKLEHNKVQSLLTVPVLSGGKVLGYVSLSAVRTKVAWTTHTTLLMRFVGEMIANTLQRQEARDIQSQHVSDLEHLNRKLAQRNFDLQKLAYVSSHDLQEPLRAVSSFSSLLQQKYHGRLDQQADEYIGYITRSAARLHRLLNDLLSFIQVDREAHRVVPCDLNDCARRAIGNLAMEATASEAQIHCAELPVVNAEPHHITQLLQLLVANALQFHGQEPPRITISAQEQDGSWVISVADNGVGVAPEYSERIFDLFQTLHPKDTVEGTGLGLAICRRIVEMHGGRIWVEPNQPAGSIFRFTMPKIAGMPIPATTERAVHHAA
jgi:PAS domain S-box-containing protein